jgi:polo-like kinase 1
MVDNYLADSGNSRPVISCILNEKDRSACIELSSVEESSRMIKLERMKLLEDDCKIIRMGE